MLNITPIPALSDNYIWVIHDNQEAIVIDPSVSEPVLAFIQDHHLSLSAILLTHHHDDHVGGVAGLLDKFTETPIYCHSHHYVHKNVRAVAGGDTVDLLGKKINIFDSQGHTDTHITFGFLDNGLARIFCGDTLFKAGCGRVFTGTIEKLYQSFQSFNQLDKYFGIASESVYFYPAHEYTLSNLKFAHHLEPNNADIQATIQQDTKVRSDNLPTLPTNLIIEQKINPFMRALNPSSELLDNARKNGYQGKSDDSLVLFSFLRQLKNTF